MEIMEILNKEEHQACLHYEKGELPTVDIRRLAKGHEEEMTFRKNEIVFMLEGRVRFTFRDHPEKTIRAGQFIFIPVGGVFRYAVLERTHVVIVRLNGHVRLCEGCHIEQLYRKGGTGGETGREVSALEVNQALRLFLDGLDMNVRGGLKCRNYFDMKAGELLLLLRAYYPPEDLREFFSLILTPDTAFSEYVRANYSLYGSIGALANSMNVTPKHFEKIFTRVFGIPPGKWINGERARLIYHELHAGVKPIKQVAAEYGFPTQQHLNRFCKRELGKNPGEIRRKRIGT